jgi:hypothetical protein
MARRRLPFGVGAIFRVLLPIAEQDEVLGELSAEYADRAIRHGTAAARRWAWRQALGSVPGLLRHGWWRGMTGFEPQANRLRPGGPMYESWIMDARYAVRHLQRRPVYAIVAVFTLALGTAGTAAVFSLAQRILLDPLPIAREEQVGVLWFAGSWNEQEILRLRPDFPGFQRMGAYRPAHATLDVTGQPLRMVSGAAVSSELLDLLGTPPLMGRTFTPGEDLAAAEPVAVLSYSLWKELGSDGSIVGKTVQFGGVSRTVVGVMPPGFWFPTPETRVWTAARMNPENRSGLLAAGAGLLIRSVVNLRALDPGIKTDRAVVIDANMPTRLSLDQRKLVIDAVLRALAALPGVEHVAATQRLPLRSNGYNFGIGIRGRGNLNQTTAFRMVTEDYFAAMGMTIRRGRSFAPSDRLSSERVVVINEALAAKFFPNEEPIGQVIVTFGDAGERIIGVVSNAAEGRRLDGLVPARYMLSQQMPIVPEPISLVVRTSGTNLAPLVQAARRTIEQERRDLAVQETTTLQAIFDASVGPAGQVVTLLTLLAMLALILGAVGVYGVISHFVQRRSREFGIRLALGQSPSLIVGRVVTRGVALVALGGVVGITAALLMSSLLASLLYGVEAADPLSMAGALTVLLAVGLFATLIPARRASRLDPAVILRQS